MTYLNPNLKPPAMRELEDFLSRHLKGQPQAIEALGKSYSAFKSSLGKLGTQENKRPIGVFLFLGPSRTGKTQSGRLLGQFLHGTPRAVTLIDCVGYQERHEIAKLIGAPPGYIGHDETPRLSEKKLYAKIPGYQTKTPASGSRSNKMEKKEIVSGELDDLFQFYLSELGLIEESLKNIDRNFSRLKRARMNQAGLFERKDNLKDQRDILQTRRNLLTASYTQMALRLLENSDIISPPTSLPSQPAGSLNSTKAGGPPKEEPILVIIFDEIEKAHESIRQFLLHVMEEGCAVLGNNEEVDLSRSFIILTSNIGSKLIGKATKGVAKIGFSSGKVNLEKFIKTELKKLFSQEFLNRLDGIVTFNILSPQDFKEILELEIEELAFHLSRISLELTVSQPTKDFILKEAAKNPEEQVKSLQDCFKKNLVNPLSNLFATGQLTGKKKLIISFDLEKNQITFKT